MDFNSFLLGVVLALAGLAVASGVGGYVIDEVSRPWGWVIVFAGVELTVCAVIVMAVLLNTVGPILYG